MGVGRLVENEMRERERERERERGEIVLPKVRGLSLSCSLTSQCPL